MFRRVFLQKSGTFLLFCALSLTPLLTGCPRQGVQSNQKEVLTYGISTDITSLDPVRATENSPRLILTQVMETLVGYDENLKLVPLLAESWTPLNNGQEWRFTLQDNVYYHDDPAFKGTPRKVKAEDVVYSIQRMLDPKTQTLGAFILADVLQGASEFIDGKATAISGVVAENERTVLFKLTKPYAQFPSRLTLPFAAITPKEAVDFYGDQWGTHPVGTGPFKFKSWDVANGKIILERNQKYWREIPTNLDEVEFAIVKSEATQLTEFSQGTLDAFEVSSALSNQIFDANGQPVEKFKTAQIKRPGSLIVYFVGLDLRNKIMQDSKFRQGLNYAIDKTALTQKILHNQATPATGLLMPPLPGADDTIPYPYDVAKAKQLIQESSYQGQELVYVTDNSTDSMAVAEFLKSQLAAVGVKITIDSNPESVWVDKLVGGKFDLGKLYFGFDYPSPDNGLSQFLTANIPPTGNNFLFYKNPKFDELYRQSLTQTDPTQATASFSQMNQIIRQDAPWIFLYFPERVVMVQKDVENLKFNKLNFSLILTDTIVKNEP